AGAFLGRRSRSPRLWLGVCQFLLAAAVAWAAYTMSVVIPNPGFDPTVPENPLDVFRMDLVRCLWAVLPAACLWGASFPLALAAVATPGQDPGRLVGRVYAANTVGAIICAAAFSILMIPWIGTQRSQQLLMVLSALSGTLVLLP